MKKKDLHAFIILIFVCLVLFSAAWLIGQSYREKYKEGYEAGRASVLETCGDRYDWEAYEDGVDSGYDIGYSDGLEDSEKADDLAYDIEKAYDLAAEKTGMSVYEAWNNILLYHDGYDPLGYPLPTYEEYTQSIETLVCFCDYMDRIDLYR